MLRILFEWFDFALERFETLLKVSNLHLNAMNPFCIVQICICMLEILFEWLEFAFQHFESSSNGSNLHSNASNPFQIVRIPFDCFEFGFQ